jgi:hypothetical protein
LSPQQLPYLQEKQFCLVPGPQGFTLQGTFWHIPEHVGVEKGIRVGGGQWAILDDQKPAINVWMEASGQTGKP